MIYSGFILGTIIVALVYKLKLTFIIITGVMMGIALPFYIKSIQHQRLEEKRLTEVSTYIETMLYSFKRKPKVLEALKDVQVLYAEGVMKNCVDKGIGFLEKEYFEGNREKKALAYIEEMYPNNLIKQMHQYFLKVESIGGEYGMAIEALIVEKNMWIDRSMDYKKECERWKRNINIGIVISILISVCILYLLPQEIAINNHLLYQIGTVISFGGYILIFLKTQKKLAIDYITSQKIDDKRILNCYQRVEHYDEKRARKTSLYYALIPLLGIVCCIIWENYVGIIIFTILLMVAYSQHKIGYYLNHKLVSEAMLQVFPQWLLEIALLMQMENVQTSIAKSKDRAPLILQPEIDKLIEALLTHPEGIEPYINFLKNYQNMEILSAMKILYSISSSSTGNVQKQIAEILDRSNRLRNYVEIQKNENSLAGMNLLFLLPVLVAGVKMLIDMTLFLMLFLQQVSI